MRDLTDSLSASGIMEILRSLYEHDMPGPENGGASNLPKAKRPASKKKKREADYLEDERDAPEESGDEESEEYNSVFVVKDRDGDYVIKSGHQARKLSEGAGKIPANSIRSAGPQAGEAAEKFSKLYEAKTVLDEIGSMLAGAGVKDAAYASEMNASTAAAAGGLRAGYRDGVVKIEYADPVNINNQWTYQRIFMKNDSDGRSVYEFTMKNAAPGSLEASVRYDSEFGTFYFESLNGVRDGHNQAYWEVWVNGNIVEEALDKKELKKGDVVEWRLANERESFCGGGGSDRRNEFEAMYRNPLGAPSGYLPDSGAGYMKPFGLHAAPLNGSYGLK